MGARRARASVPDGARGASRRARQRLRLRRGVHLARRTRRWEAWEACLLAGGEVDLLEQRVEEHGVLLEREDVRLGGARPVGVVGFFLAILPGADLVLAAEGVALDELGEAELVEDGVVAEALLELPGDGVVAADRLERGVVKAGPRALDDEALLRDLALERRGLESTANCADRRGRSDSLNRSSARQHQGRKFTLELPMESSA